VTSAISKQELRRNVLAEWIGACIGTVRAHRRAALAVVVAAVLAVAGGLGYRWYQESREREASRAFAAASLTLRTQNPQSPPDPVEGMKRLREVAQTYRGTPSAKEALVRLAYLEYDAQKYDEALATFEEYATTYPKGRFRVEADLGKGYALIQKQNLEGAAQVLAGAVARDASEPLAGEAYMALARVYEAQKKPDEALKVYGQVVEKFPQTNWAAHALQRMSEVKR